MRAILALILLAGALLAGCTSPGDGANDGFVTPNQDDEGRYVILMTNGNRYMPQNAQVPVGSTVVWVNQGSNHDIVADDGAFRSPPANEVRADGEWELHITEDLLGDHPYHCSPHRTLGMVGVLRVVAASTE